MQCVKSINKSTLFVIYIYESDQHDTDNINIFIQRYAKLGRQNNTFLPALQYGNIVFQPALPARKAHTFAAPPFFGVFFLSPLYMGAERDGVKIGSKIKKTTFTAVKWDSGHMDQYLLQTKSCVYACCLAYNMHVLSTTRVEINIVLIQAFLYGDIGQQYKLVVLYRNGRCVYLCHFYYERI